MEKYDDWSKVERKKRFLTHFFILDLTGDVNEILSLTNRAMTKLLALILLLWLVSVAYGLTRGEKDALEAFQTTWPGLQLVTPSWNRSVLTACDPPVFYGLTCDNGPDPHITGMYAGIFFSPEPKVVFFSLVIPYIGVFSEVIT